MKKRILVLTLMFVLLLTGCSTKLPEKDAAGNAWSADWTTVGSLLGVESRADWTLSRSEDVLAAEGMYYFVWTKGEAVTYTNAFEEEVTAHQAEIHLIVSESPSAEEAQKVAAEWEQLTRDRYPDAAESQATFSGQTFAVSTYAADQSHGASASAQRDTAVIRVDVVTLNDENPEMILADFLNVCHYAK